MMSRTVFLFLTLKVNCFERLERCNLSNMKFRYSDSRFEFHTFDAT